MRSRLRRLLDLLRRYRIDRRLPPPVARLWRRTIALRAQEAWSSSVASLRPVVGGTKSEPIGRLGARRYVTAGPLPVSTHDLGHEVATAIVDALVVAGLAPFVVDRVGDRLVVGLELADREAALISLARSVAEPGWYLRWSDGPRSGIVPLGRAARHRPTRRARSWIVYRAHSRADVVLGLGQGTEITFWEIGTSDQFEMVGTRGHERFDPRSGPTTELIDGREYPGRTAFPVGRSLERVVEPVDFVYTWVDGADPAWREHFQRTAVQFGRSLDDQALDPARYRSRDELRYSLRSVWAYCGWVRRIWIVTAGQRPDWLADDDRIRIVDHREILPASALPTFNSHAIESALHRIDGLAEQFVYFNDDVLVGRPLRPELFFTPNGLARVFLSGARIPGAEGSNTIAVDTAARRGRELLEARFGRVVSHKPYHAPHPLRRSSMLELEKDFADAVRCTEHSRFRSPDDLSIASSFAQHYALATGGAVLGDITNEYVHVESGRLAVHLDRIRLGGDLDSYCINETQDGASDAPRRDAQIRAFFEEVVPFRPPWER